MARTLDDLIEAERQAQAAKKEEERRSEIARNQQWIANFRSLLLRAIGDDLAEALRLEFGMGPQRPVYNNAQEPCARFRYFDKTWRIHAKYEDSAYFILVDDDGDYRGILEGDSFRSALLLELGRLRDHATTGGANRDDDEAPF